MELGLLISIIGTVIEVVIIYTKNLGADGDIYIGTVFMAVFLVLLFANVKIKGRVPATLSYLGKKYSSIIYIVHVFVIGIWNMFYESSGYNDIIYYLGPLTVFMGSLLVAVVIDKIRAIDVV